MVLSKHNKYITHYDLRSNFPYSYLIIPHQERSQLGGVFGGSVGCKLDILAICIIDGRIWTLRENHRQGQNLTFSMQLAAELGSLN